MAATNKRGVFSLETVLERQSDNHWTDIFDPFIYVASINPEQSAGPAYGYVAGGDATGGSGLSTNQRIDFANDTSGTSQRGNFPTQVEMSGGAGNSSYGYTMGGYDGISWNGASMVYRVDYANDNVTATTKGPLSAGRKYCNSVGNNNYGYTGSGYPSGPIMDRIDYANDTSTATSLGNIFSPGDRGYATAGNQSFGYFAGGGGNFPRVSTVSRLDYANDGVATSPKGPLIGVLDNTVAGAGTGNVNFGYFQTNNGYQTTTQVSRVDYGNDTATALSKGPLTANCYMRSATGNSSYGYFSGGYQWPVFNINTIDRIDYANDTATASPKGSLNPGVRRTVGFSAREHGLPNSPSPKSVTPATQLEPPSQVGGPAYGYVAGGDYTQQVSRIDYANDTATASPRGSLTSGRSRAGGTGNTSYGYVTGGVETPVDPTSKVDRIDYSNDSSTASPKGKLSAARKYLGSVGNANYGYTGGGSDAPSPTYAYQSRMDRIDYANDTAIATSLGNIFVPLTSSAQYGTAGNLNYGYMAGGGFPRTSICRRIDYANDSVAASPKGPLSSEASDNAGTGNINFGYFQTNRGYLSPTTICRLDYANDTNTASPKGPLVATVYRRTATGSQSFGYFCGGGQQPTKYSFVERIDYANDTATASPKGNLAFDQGRSQSFSGQEHAFGGTPSVSVLVDKGSDGYLTPVPYSYGPAHSYIVGGWYYNNANATSYVTRLNWSNNSITPTTKLANPVQRTVGANSKDYGYISSTYPASTHAWRIDFSTDGSTYLPSVMSTNAEGRGAVSNVNHGYWGGGAVPGLGTVSTIDRLDFANDTSGTLIKGPLAVQVYGTAGAGNKNFGWFGGGNTNTSSIYGNINKLNYANDTVTLPSSFAGTGVPSVTGTGNANYGYFKDGSWYAPVKSTVYRLDYANDTLGGSSRLNLLYAVSDAAGASSESQGAFCMGFTVGRPSPGYGNATSLHYYAQYFNYANDTSMGGQFTPSYYSAKAGSTGARHNDVSTGGPVYIPRVRWIDSKAEEQGTSPSPNPAYSNPSMAYTIGGEGQPGPLPYAAPAQRIDMSNDTATALAKAGAAPPTDRLYYCSSVGNRDYAWTSMGANYSNVQRLDYANDSAQMVNRCNRQPGVQLGFNERATGNNDYGYFSGGNINYTIPGCGYYAPSLSKVNRMTYASDTTNTVFRCNTSYGSGGRSACGNSDYGWWIGGSYTYCNNYASTYVERLDYANDTGGTVNRGPLTHEMNYGGAQGNANNGWALAVGPSTSSRVNRITYASDTTTATPKGNLAASTSYQSTTGSQSFGYNCGGNPHPGSTTVNRIDYANDTATASPKGPLVWRIRTGGGASASENDIAISPSPSTDIPGDPGFLAPYQPPFPFPVESLNPFNFGYFVGGSTSGNAWPDSTGVAFSQIQRIDYTNDTATAMYRGRTSFNQYATEYISGTSSAIYGYWAGFSPASNYPTDAAERLDFANDTADTVLRTSVLATILADCAAVGNKNFGYWAGGAGPGSPYAKSYITRLDFSNDTGGGTPKGYISQGRYALSGISNQSYGYIVGGYQSDTSPSRSTKVERLDFSNDTGTTLKGPLASARHQAGGGIGNANYGYSVGGQITGNPSSPPTVTTVERINFANDTATASPKGPLSQSRWGLAGTGDQSYGYVSGGELQYSDPYSQVTTIDRIDFANDTATAAPKGNLEKKVRKHAAISAAAAANSP